MMTQTTRRRFIQLAIAGGVAAVGSRQAKAMESETVRNRFWIWSHYPGVYDGMFGLPRKSRITPVAAAEYLGTPNIMFIHANGKPTFPLDRYAAAFRKVKNLQWSIVGSAGRTSDLEREQVLKLAATMPNISGLYMDDFFNFARQGRKASMTVDQVKSIRERMFVRGRQLQLGVVVYVKDKFDERMLPYLKLCDTISLWFWSSKELDQLESSFARLREVAPGKRLQMGCYMWDYGARRPMPLDRIRRQCDQGLKWLRQGRIADMIFCGAHLCDQGLEAVDWTRNWVARVGDQPLEK